MPPHSADQSSSKPSRAWAALTLALALSIIMLAASPTASAQAPNTVEIERQQQAARDAQLKAQTLQPNANAAPTPPVAAANAANAAAPDASKQSVPTWLPYSPLDAVSQPCFTIQAIEWQGNERAALFGGVTTQFDWLSAQAMPILRRCVDAATLRGLQDHLGQSLIQAGYVTTRVLIPEQSLAQGQLKIIVVPGKIAGTVAALDAAPSAASPAIGVLSLLLPSRAGKLLNQRDLDHALENARRPTATPC